MPRVDLDRIDTNDFCCRCDSVPIAHGTLTALIAELRAARAVVELAREWVTDGVPLSDNWSDRTIAAVMAYDALTQPERGEAG